MRKCARTTECRSRSSVRDIGAEDTTASKETKRGLMRKLVPIGFTLMVLVSACGPGDPTTLSPQESEHGDHAMDMGEKGFAFGEPGNQSEVGLMVEISALDSLEFDPETLEVQPGETITFVVTNDGKNVHEFVLGDESYQQEHAAEMSGGEQMGAGANQIEIEPGATKSLTWTFTQPGEVLYGCHEPGHYEGGMVGTIEMGS